MPNLCAVLVTFNRKVFLAKCIDSLLSQSLPFEKIIIIDNNSKDDTKNYLAINGYLDQEKIEFISLEENIGGSGGFHYGINLAFSQGYEWIFILDDDTELDQKAIEILFDIHKCSKYLNVLACNVETKEGVTQLAHRGTFNGFQLKKTTSQLYAKSSFSVDYSSFVGLLLNRVIVERYGLPNKEFFIWHDDVEYTLRISKTEKIVVCTRAIIRHYDENTNRNGNNKNSIELFWKKLCGYRNYLYLLRKHSRQKLFSQLFYIIFIFFRTIVLEKQKFFRIKLIIKYINQKDLTSFNTIKPEQWSKIIDSL